MKATNMINIDIKEFFWSLLEQWKCVLIAAVIFALLVPVLLSYRSSGDASDGFASSLAGLSESELLDKLEGQSREDVIEALDSSRLISGRIDYLESSILAGLDANKLRILHEVWIDSASDPGSLYGSVIKDQDMTATVRSSFGDPYLETEDIYINELIRVSCDKGIDLVIILPDDVDADAVKNAVEQKVDPNGLSLALSEVQIISDEEMALDRMSSNVQLRTLMNNLTARIDNFSDEQLAVYNAVLSPSDTLASVQDTTDKAHVFTPGRLVLGFAIGMILYVFCYLLYIVISSVIQCREAITDAFGMRDLGKISHYRYKGLAVISHCSWLYKIHRKNSINGGSLAPISDSIVSSCKYNSSKNVAFVLAGNMKAYSEEADKLIAKVGGSGPLTVKRLDTPLADDNISGADAIVVCVGSEKTKYKDVDEVVRLCGLYDKKIIGGVFFD